MELVQSISEIIQRDHKEIAMRKAILILACFIIAGCAGPQVKVIEGQMEFCREALIRDQAKESPPLVDPSVLRRAHASLAMSYLSMLQHFSDEMQIKFMDACIARGEELGLVRGF